MIKRWKFLRKKGRYIRSENGNCTWKIGEWKKEKTLDMCSQGFHCSKNPYQAFSYVQGGIVALVECKGKHLTQDDKECWQEQRIIKAYKWTKKDSLKLAIFSAELVLKNYEKEYPNDLRPREAIEAVKKVLFKNTAKNRSAAWSAAESAWSAACSAACSAAGSAAESAAWSAAWSAARSAAESAAWSAARSAAWSAACSAAWSAAESAAESARSAAWSSACSAAIKKIEKYFMKLVSNLEEIS